MARGKLQHGKFIYTSILFFLVEALQVLFSVSFFASQGPDTLSDLIFCKMWLYLTANRSYFGKTRR